MISGAPTSAGNAATMPAALGSGVAQGSVPGDTQLSLRIALSLRNEDDLDATLAAMYDPNSPQYLQFLTNEQFAAAYLPTADQVAQVKNALSAQGLTTTSAQGFLLNVSGTAADIATFFKTTLTTYTGADGNSYYGPSASVEIPEGLPIAAVHGLYTPPVRHASYVLASSEEAQAMDPLRRRQPPAQNTTFGASAIRQAYNIPASATGAGQVLALFELDGYNASDIAAYVQQNNISAVPLQNVLVNGFDGQVHNTNAEVEVALDIELMNAIAPGAAQIRVYEGANSGASSLDILNEMANPSNGMSLPTMISTSWGLAEDQETASELNSEGTLFKQMAAQGQSFFAASGDSGAFDDGRRLSVDDPASQPYVIGAGGTTLTVSNGAFASEAAWVDSGGGVSAVHAIPSWQTNLVGAGSGGSKTMRNVPDVALNANPSTGYVIVAGGQQLQVGGTSCAAPEWAAFLALVNQQRAAANKSPTGFVAPALYSVGASSNGTADFHDVTTGNNGHFPAVPGYDDATGWGSFNGAALINALSQ